MALVDTGLGWYAEDRWLMNTAGTIGKIVTSGGTSEGMVVTNTPQYIWTYLSTRRQYLSKTTSGEVLAAGFDSSSNTYDWIASSPVQGQQVLITFSDISTRIYVDLNHYDQQTGLYYNWGGAGVHLTEASPDFPLYPSMNEALIAMSGGTPQTIEFDKTSAGYSVTCMCKWKTEIGGDVYCSPVLVSSAQNNTLYTRDGSTPSVNTTEHTFSGMTFYMRKAPLDVVDGTETIIANFPVLDYSSSPPITNDALFALIAAASELGVGPLPEDDPYSGGGESGPDAGDPTFDFTSEDIPVPNIPSIGAFNTGFINMYKPTVGDLRDLAHYLWSGSFDPENLRKLIANPMDAILGLHIVPATASHPAGSAATLYVGNIDTQLSMLRLTEQYYELDCGTITIEPKWGAYLDYAPYSKLTLYLPYIGFVPISPDDCMGGSINVKYHVDVLSGACCVYVYCTSNRGEDSHVLYSYTGACACDCPVTEGQYTNAILGILNIAGSVAGAISGALTGNAGGVTGGIESAANAALSMVKPDISRSGSFGGSAGLMGIQYPYLVLTVPRMCTPGDQQKQEGYPSFVTKAMGQLAGYNQVQVKRLEGMTCTANETEEILTLLEGGAIF